MSQISKRIFIQSITFFILYAVLKRVLPYLFEGETLIWVSKWLKVALGIGFIYLVVQIYRGKGHES